MATKSIDKIIGKRLVRVCRIHFYLVLALAVQIMVYDAWKLIAPEAVLQRWVLTAVLLIATAIVWYQAKSKANGPLQWRRLVFALAIVDIIVISFLVYMTRGMASRAVALYVLPVLSVGLIGSRAALYTSAFLSIAAYTTAAVAYFVLNFNEGYKIELYGEVGFYAAAMLLFAGAAWAILNPASRD